MDPIKQTGIGLIVMVLGIVLMIIPFIIISIETHGTSHIGLGIFYTLLSIGFFLFIFSFPIMGVSKKDKV